jgi:hypothetical protein
VPIALEIIAANIHDKWMAGATLDAVVLRAPRGPRRPTNLCLERAFYREYDHSHVPALASSLP